MISDQTIVHYSNSTLQGCKEVNGTSSFWGIPYAEPPIGSLRFKPPVKKALTNGVIDATKPGNISWQWIKHQPKWARPAEKMSEDCLYLNVFTPNIQGKLPVLFWIHGGASIWGAGSDPVLKGDKLAAKGMVVVTFNYRLGALGFLVHPELSDHSTKKISGNYGVMDILCALEWVKEHIAAFGGDPNHIVMGGQSAGAGAIAYLMTSPLMTTELKGAILLSTSPTSYPEIPYGLAYYSQKGQDYMGKISLYSYNDLMTASVETWTTKESMMLEGGFSFVRDQYVFNRELKESFVLGNYQKIPTIMSMTRVESVLGISATDQWNDSDYQQRVKERLGKAAEVFFKIDKKNPEEGWAHHFKEVFAGEWALTENIYAAECMSLYQADVYLSRFDRNVPRQGGAFLGPLHSDDLYYYFGTFEAAPFAWQEDDYALSQRMQSFLAEFVKTGKAGWPAFQKDSLMTWGGPDGRHDRIISLKGQQRLNFLKKIRNT